MQRVLAYNKTAVSVSKHSFTPFLHASKNPSQPRKLPSPETSRGVNVNMAKEFNLKIGDNVRVLYGRDSGRSGVIEKIMPEKNQVIVSGMNVIRSYSRRVVDPITHEVSNVVQNVPAPIHVTNIAPLDPVLKQPTRIKRRYSMNGECVRISKLSGCAMPESSEAVKPTQTRSSTKSVSRRAVPVSSGTRDSMLRDKSHFQSLVDLNHS
jgi:large subunit ribosomal protein L24